MLESIKNAQAIGPDLDTDLSPPTTDTTTTTTTGVVHNFTVDECSDIIMADEKLRPKSKETYRASIRRFFALVKCTSIAECLKPSKYKASLRKIDTEQSFKTSAKLGTFQILVKLLDKRVYAVFPSSFSQTHRDTLFKYLITRFEVYKAMSEDESKARKVATAGTLPSFDEYIQAALTTFGADSKQYLIAVLYDVVTAREDFAMKIIKNVRENVNADNYLLHTKTQTTFYINSYKTDARGPYVRKLNLKKKNEALLHKLIGNWITSQKKSYGDWFLGKSPLGPYTNKQMHSQLGYTNLKGISVFRNMKVSDILGGEELTYEKRQELAKSMMHSMSMQLKYDRRAQAMVAD
jgi:hypothetical protein